MSGGRKQKYNTEATPTTHSYSFRMNDDDFYRLEELVEATGKSKAEVLRHGMDLYYHVLKIKGRI